MKFKLRADYKPTGDQPKAIEQLVTGINNGFDKQILLGVTGSGKTFTVANVIAQVQKPTLVIAHNKTLAAQLCQELRNFFPDNAVEYFVSYYDYYQPEAYLPNSDTYIEKDSAINDEVEKLRHSATASLLSRKDVIIVATVSCIYGLGSPEEYKKKFLDLKVGDRYERNTLIRTLISMFYERNSILARGTFNVVGENFEILPIDREEIYRLEIENEKLKKIIVLDSLTRSQKNNPERVILPPAKHFIASEAVIDRAFRAIKAELKERTSRFLTHGKITEAERLERRTNYDLEMIKEIGYCKGIENYSLYLSGRKKGEPPYTLMDFFPDNFLTVIDESHVTVPQIGGMYEGDRSRKNTLIEYGFRLPSAADNRPLKFNEFEKLVGQTIYLSATPGKYELNAVKKQSYVCHPEFVSGSNDEIPGQARNDIQGIVEQIIRPTGLVDPKTEIRPIKDQVQDAINEIKIEAKEGNRILVTTLTKKMAEDLSKFLEEQGVRAKYLHSDIDTLDRVKILQDLRKGKFDCLVGVNLLREGLDLPEVTLVTILDADKEGFLRSETSLVQTIGRAARNVTGRVILYADNITGSIKRALAETNRRRDIQIKYNKDHRITPTTIKKNLADFFEDKEDIAKEFAQTVNLEEIPSMIKDKTREMKQLAKDLKFEDAMLLRDEINALKKLVTK